MIKSYEVTVGTTAVQLVSPDVEEALLWSETLTEALLDVGTLVQVTLGAADVVAGTGWAVDDYTTATSPLVVRPRRSDDVLYGRTAEGTAKVRVLAFGGV